MASRAPQRLGRMPRRRDIVTLAEAGVPWEEIGERLGVQPGLAYLVATGLSADGSDAPSADARDRPGFLATSQHLSNPQPADNPTSRSAVHDWIRRRAASDGQMQRAGAARTPDPGPRQAGEEEADLADVLTRDHNQVTNLLKQLATIPGAKKGGSPARMSARKSIVDMIGVSLAGHVAAEHDHLWPTVRSALDDGEELADQALEMDRHGDDLLAALGELDGTEEEFDDLVEELSLAARKHVAFQEPVFLRLREAVPREELLALAARAVHTDEKHDEEAED